MNGTAEKIATVGVIEGPGWHDPTADDISSILGDSVTVLREPLDVAGFNWSLSDMAGSRAAIEQSAAKLSDRGCTHVLQAGPAFAYMLAGSISGGRELEIEIGRVAGCTMIMSGAAMHAAMQSINAAEVALVCPYYDEAWKSWLIRLLRNDGYQVRSYANFFDAGVFASHDQIVARSYDFAPWEVEACVRHACDTAQDAGGGIDAIWVAGAGVRTLSWARDIGERLGAPVIGADWALMRSLMISLGVESPLVKLSRG